MINSKIIGVGLFVIILTSSTSCKKDWLDAKSNILAAVPSTVEDFQSILDNPLMCAESPALGMISCDDYYLSTTSWNSLSIPQEKNAYIFNKEIFDSNTSVPDWNTPYTRIYYANLVIDGVSKMVPSPETELSINSILGSALFFKSVALYELAQVFAKPYNETSAQVDNNIPVRNTTNFNIESTRSITSQLYSQIISDLKLASEKLPIKTANKLRPTKAAAFGALARVFLVMSNFKEAKNYSNLCIKNFDGNLLDFNTLNKDDLFPISQFNAEVIFHSTMVTYNSVSANYISLVDSNLYKSYKSDDLRKSIYYGQTANGTVFKASYGGAYSLFSGIALDEMYLIRAESFARMDSLSQALTDVNTLLRKRFINTIPYIPITSSNKMETMKIVLDERRRELAFRDARWIDLRRLNMEVGYETIVRKVVDNKTYELLPNTNRYVMPIPPLVLQQTNLEQNPR